MRARQASRTPKRSSGRSFPDRATSMLSIAALSGDQGNYYLALARDDYYLKGGEPPGRWLGEGARQLGLTGTVEGPALKQLLRGFTADGREPLIQGAGSPKHQPGWDLTFRSEECRVGKGGGAREYEIG